MDDDPASYVPKESTKNDGCFSFEHTQDASLDCTKQEIHPNLSIGALGPIRIIQHFGDLENVKTVEDLKRDALDKQTIYEKARKTGRVSFLEQVEVMNTEISEPVHKATLTLLAETRKDKDYAKFIRDSLREDNSYNRYAILMTLDDSWAEEIEFEELGETKEEDELLNEDKNPSRLYQKKTLKTNVLTSMPLKSENATKLKTVQLCQNAAFNTGTVRNTTRTHKAQ